MKTLNYPEFGRLSLDEMPEPTASADEVLLRVAACGICGSELESFQNRSPRRPPPLVMGHEFCGTVVAVGADVTSFRVGDKVISHSVVHCGKCRRCREGRTHLCSNRQVFGMHRAGAFAEWVNVPERVLIRWPDSLEAAEASFAEPLANGVHVFNLTRHLAAQTVLLIGAGPIGLMCQLAMQSLSNSRFFVSEPNPRRCEISKRFGARTPGTLASEGLAQSILRETEGEGVDLVIDAVGSASTKEQSLTCLRPGGTAVWIGLHEDVINLNSRDLTLTEKQVFGTYAATMQDLRMAVDLLSSGQVKVAALADLYSLSDGIRGFENASRGLNIKSVIIPS